MFSDVDVFERLGIDPWVDVELPDGLPGWVVDDLAWLVDLALGHLAEGDLLEEELAYLLGAAEGAVNVPIPLGSLRSRVALDIYDAVRHARFDLECSLWGVAKVDNRFRLGGLAEWLVSTSRLQWERPRSGEWLDCEVEDFLAEMLDRDLWQASVGAAFRRFVRDLLLSS